MANTFTLRQWQQDAQTIVISRHWEGLHGDTVGDCLDDLNQPLEPEEMDGGSRVFFCVAGVGAGKTTFATTTARRLFDLRYYDKVFFVSPQRSVRMGFTDTAARFGMQLNHILDSNQPEVVFDQFDGLSVTYAGLQSLDLIREYIDEDTLVVLDEPHHLSENRNKGTASGWYRAAIRLFRNAGYIMLMTGTPYRTVEDEVIPFARYKSKGLLEILQADYYYSYGQAVRDGVVARCAFIPCYGAGMYTHKHIEYSFDLEDEDPNEDEPKVLKTLLEPDTDYVAGVLNQAIRKLEAIRTPENNYGGLVVCKDKEHARQIAAYMHNTYGIAPALVLDDEGDGLKIIEAFKDDTRRWVVAVKMVSEGTDIPRLKVCAYLSNVRTMLFFVQVKGRIVRRTLPPHMDEVAYMFYPAIESMRRHIRMITKDLTDKFTAREIRLGVAPPERNPAQFEILQATFSGEVDFSIAEIPLEPVHVKAYKIQSLRRDIADLAKVYAQMDSKRKGLSPHRIGSHIANIHRYVNKQVGVEYQEDMSLEQLQFKCDILLNGIEILKGTKKMKGKGKITKTPSGKTTKN